MWRRHFKLIFNYDWLTDIRGPMQTTTKDNELRKATRHHNVYVVPTSISNAFEFHVALDKMMPFS